MRRLLLWIVGKVGQLCVRTEARLLMGTPGYRSDALPLDDMQPKGMKWRAPK
jgi:hypothetical protein